jgi:hypothetical protein
MAKPSYPRRKPEETAAEEPQTEEETVYEAPRRMTAEEVRAAREASRQQYSRVIRDTDDEKYDTAMLDISKIVGFKDELNETFEMVDMMPDDTGSRRTSGSREGGTND